MTTGADRASDIPSSFQDDESQRTSPRAGTELGGCHLPTAIRVLNALYSANFQLPSLALLYIVNSRAQIPPAYLPAYSAISFLPNSLRPIIAMISTYLLDLGDSYKFRYPWSMHLCEGDLPDQQRQSQPHYASLLPFAFILAACSFVGTSFIPEHGIGQAFVWGFLRGVSTAWIEFLLGMMLIDCSRQSSEAAPIMTAQMRTARNLGTMVSSVATFGVFLFLKNEMSPTIVATLLFGTAALHTTGAVVAMWYHRHRQGTKNSWIAREVEPEHDYEPLVNNIQAGATENIRNPLDYYVGHHHILRFQESGSFICGENNSGEIGNDHGTPSDHQDDSVLKTFAMLFFQVLLAVSALKEPLISVSSLNIWIGVIVSVILTLVGLYIYGTRYSYELRQPTRPKSSGRDTIPHNQLVFFFLSRNISPSAGMLLSSYNYTAFESEPLFLQALSFLQSAFGTLATSLYETFLAQYSSGWPLIRLMAALDVLTGSISMLDIFIVREINSRSSDSNDGDGINVSLDNQLRVMVIGIEIIKYFFAEIDYMPSNILAATNVRAITDAAPRPICTSYSEKEDQGQIGDTLQQPYSILGNGDEQTEDEHRQEDEDVILSLNIGIQYATFLSCVDFGYQLSEWISVPIIGALGITRENQWANLTDYIIICSLGRMLRIIFLPLISPRKKPSSYESN